MKIVSANNLKVICGKRSEGPLFDKCLNFILLLNQKFNKILKTYSEIFFLKLEIPDFPVHLYSEYKERRKIRFTYFR